MFFKVEKPDGHVKPSRARTVHEQMSDMYHISLLPYHIGNRNPLLRIVAKMHYLHTSFHSCRQKSMPRHLLCILLILSPAVAPSQLLHRYGDLLTYTDSVVSVMPSGTSVNNYQTPAVAYRDAWKILFSNVLQLNDSLAASQAQALSYRLVAFTDTSNGNWPAFQEFRILEKLPASSNYWGTYILAVSPARPQLVLQAPHPLNDSRTGLQSVYVFRAVGARAFFLSGTHRCNSAVFSPCDGTTSTCGTSEPYRESDPAHAVTTQFHVATIALEELEQPYVVQLHGFAKQTTDPHLIMSNSTSLTPSVDLLSQIRDALLTADNTLTFKIAHLDPTWTRLTGTTNVQGRLINGSSAPCGSSSPSNAGRFFHIEQAYSGLRDNATGWQKMASALATVFASTSGAIAEESVPSGFRLEHNYPNPFNPSTALSFTLPVEAGIVLDIVNMSGQVVATLTSGVRQAGVHTVRWNADVAAGVYLARLRVTALDHRRTTTQLVQKLVLAK